MISCPGLPDCEPLGFASNLPPPQSRCPLPLTSTLEHLRLCSGFFLVAHSAQRAHYIPSLSVRLFTRSPRTCPPVVLKVGGSLPLHRVHHQQPRGAQNQAGFYSLVCSPGHGTCRFFSPCCHCPPCQGTPPSQGLSHSEGTGLKGQGIRSRSMKVLG